MHASNQHIPEVCKRWQWISKLRYYKVKRRDEVDEDIETSAGLINKFLLRFKSVDCIDLINFPVRNIATLEKILELPYTPKSLKMHTPYKYEGLANISVEIYLSKMKKKDKLKEKVLEKCRENKINLKYFFGWGLHQREDFHDLNKKK